MSGPCAATRALHCTTVDDGSRWRNPDKSSVRGRTSGEICSGLNVIRFSSQILQKLEFFLSPRACLDISSIHASNCSCVSKPQYCVRFCSSRTSAPRRPGSPLRPGGPAGSASPFGPAGPASPFSPCRSCGPAGPCAPASSVAPFSPCGPAGPGGPCAPAGPCGPAAPCGPATSRKRDGCH